MLFTVKWEDEAGEEELTTEDYRKLDATVEKMAAFFEKYKDDIDETAKTDIYDFLIRDVMGAAAGSAKGRRIINLLPAYPESLSKVKESGGSLAYSQPKSVRSIEWLESHGRCIDNIRPGASTIPHAGTLYSVIFFFRDVSSVVASAAVIFHVLLQQGPANKNFDSVLDQIPRRKPIQAFHTHKPFEYLP